MKISLITCCTPDYLIGTNNKLPWHLPADLARFKKITSGHIIVMGRKTHESIGRPLPNRTNVVFSRQLTLLSNAPTPNRTNVVFSRNRFKAPGCYVIPSMDELKTIAGNRECFVIGGAQIYRLFMPDASRIYHTLVKTEGLSGDTYFPSDLLKAEDWSVVESHDRTADEKNKYDLCFRCLKRIKSE